MAPSNSESVGRATMSKDMTPSVAVGARCYIPDDDSAWLPVYVEEVNEQKGLVTVRIQRPRKDQQDEDTVDHDDADRSGESRVVPMDVGFPLQNAQLSRYDEGLDNMIDLNHLHEAAILRNLKKRFRARKPYTYTGDICLAVNPYQWLDELYTPGLHKKYLQARKRQDLPPHVYAVSVAAFRHMCDNGSNQSILVSGESGAGKTETTKILMDNLATIAPAPTATASDQEHSITTRIIEVNPLLESFGNAKTTRNDNSSRFGKFTQLQFDKNHALCGAQCETYLLEKTRVISHERGERNYHIFYQLLHGTTDEERDALGLGAECPKFSYLEEKEPRLEVRPGRKSRPSAPPPPKSVSMIEAENAKDRALFSKTRQALSLLGLSPDQQNDLFQVLSGILHLGEAQFVAQPDNDEACDLDKDSVIYSCVLLGLDPDTMGKALTHRTMKAAGEVYLVPLTVEQAQSGRDALAKAIYASIFDWLVAGINASLGAAPRLTANTIGVLDIFGFETFEFNSFEQLCINYANEKLQQKFTQDVFKAVQEEYEREKITWAHISYADNSDTLALIEGRMGVLALLNEEIVRPRGNEEGFVSKLSGAYLKQKNLIEFPRISKTQFAIHHYAGTVKYEAMGFLEKHKDALLSDLSDLMCGSHEAFPQMLFKVRAEIEAAAAASAATLKRSTSGGRGARGGAGGAGGDKTVGMQFKQSLNSLMTNINETNVNYIRCIKPNSAKSSTLLEDKMVANQLRCAGVIEAICIARAGYPNRLLHAEFAEQFDIFLTEQEQIRQKEDPEQYGEAHCRILVKKFKLEMPEEYQMGVTKIYLQKGVLEKCEHAKAQKLFAYVALIQAHWRGMRTRCEYYEMRSALITIQRRAKVFVTRCRFLRAQLAIALIQRVWRGYVANDDAPSLMRLHRLVLGLVLAHCLSRPRAPAMVLRVSSTPDEVGAAVGQLIFDLSKQAIAAHGRFTVALSGGSLPKILNKGLEAIKGDVDFSKWFVYFADERCVALDHDDSNYKACKAALFDFIPVPASQIYTIDASLTPEAMAVDYTKKLAEIWGSDLPRFDLILLGMGPDGHTCSLFPGHPLLEEKTLFVASIEDSPKPPPQRITLTYPVVNNAANVAFVATGSGKAELMPHMIGVETRSPPLPAANVKPTDGVVYWFIDEDAAAKLSDEARM
ncbi:hypothetical protein ON010_g186 [Phytophthora cinnamomi]|nr:hypothetical protein ON010_g186 [Phytophthora cinnamomi]